MSCDPTSPLTAFPKEKNRANPNYISRQRDINQNMRAILVDWLVEVVEEYRLTTDTLYLTINLVDRFLSTTHITREKLQLVGVASMLIASYAQIFATGKISTNSTSFARKFEEITPPLVEEFVYICDSSYTRLEVRWSRASLRLFIEGSSRFSRWSGWF